MNERVIQFRVGVVVVAATIITGIMIMLFGEGRAFVRSQYTILLRFSKAPGVTVDTPVRKHGVLIGRVTKVELEDQDAADEGGVLLTARIDADRTLRRNEVCVIKTSSLLGDAVLEFVPSNVDGASRQVVQDGDLLADGIVASDPLEVLSNLEGSVGDAIGSIESAANEVQVLAQNLNNTLGSNDDQLQRIMDKTEDALTKFSSTMTTVDDLFGDQELRDSLKQSMEGLPQTFENINATLVDARTTFQSFQNVSRKAEQNLDNLEEFTRPLAERGPDLVAGVDSSVQNLDNLLGQLVEFSGALNSREGSLGQFVHNPELYNRLNNAAEKIEFASRGIDPIVRNVRTFTDKIARDPRILGAKGAIDRRPSGLGLKSTSVP